MPRIVRFHQTGPADVLRIEELPQQDPKDNEVRIKVEAIGPNARIRELIAGLGNSENEWIRQAAQLASRGPRERLLQ